jgi:O-acetyl-ADP-ribose deacetylase (regulator of RNase III)
MTALELHVGDITALAVDAIVNAANEALRGGGGVDGAIHRAAGPELMTACIAIGPTGEARITPGPPASAGEDALLASCYRESLKLAAAHGVASIAFPAISTGIYGFPPGRAAPIAVESVRAHAAPSLRRAIFCCFSEAAAAHYRPLI